MKPVFKGTVKVCPACQSGKFTYEHIVSKDGFMTIGDYNHLLCLDCGTVFIKPRPSEAQLGEFYNSHEVESRVETELLTVRSIQ